MSSKGTITVEVDANTKKASGQLKQFKSEVNNLNGKGGGILDGLNVGKIDLGGIKNTFGEISTNFESLKSSFSKGIDLKSFSNAATSAKNLGASLTSVVSKSGLISKSMGMLCGPAGVVLGAAAAFKALNNTVKDWIDNGRPAYEATEKVSRSLTLLDKNMGGAGRNFAPFIQSMKDISNNGVSSFETLDSASRQLMVALKGDETQTLSLLKVFDTLAAGTQIQADDWASMASEVFNTGVSIKDLTRLSNKGIPIYQALGKAMGVTAEEAESMAKKGIISTQNWVDAIYNLSDVYRGLSKQMSEMTVDQVNNKIQASYDRMNSNASATRGYEQVVLPDRQERLQEVQQQEQLYKDLFSNVKEGIGRIKGHFDNFFSAIGDSVDDFGTKLKVTLYGVIDAIGGFSKDNEDEAAKKERKFVIDQMKEFTKGNLNLAQMKDLAAKIETDKYKVFSDEDGSLKTAYMDILTKLRSAIKESWDEGPKGVDYSEIDAKGQRAMKYGSIEDKTGYISNLMGRAGLTQVGSPQELPEIYNKLREQYVNGEVIGAMGLPVEDLEKVKQILDMMGPVVNEVQSANEKAAQSEKELAAARDRAAQAAQNAAQKAKQDEINEYIKQKAELGRNINQTQSNYDSVTDKLERLRAERQVISQEEAAGIYRKKWENLDMAELSSQENELVKQQAEAGKKLDELKNKYDNFDQNWAKTRSNLEQVTQNFLSKVPIVVKNLASLAG